MADTFVRYERADSVGYIVLNRPPANSYEIEFMRHLNTAIDQANEDERSKIIVVKSALEKFFSAGADIKAFAANSTADNMRMVEVAHQALAKIPKSSKIFIAAIHGHALGGGLEIALACDLRLAASGNYRIGLPEVTLGLLPGNGGTQRLSRLIGANKALELMITGQTLLPEEAEKLGIVNKTFPADSFMDEVEAYVKNLAAGATKAISYIKKAVYDGIAMHIDTAMELERNLIAELFDSEDAKEGLKAFVEKRKPTFQGK